MTTSAAPAHRYLLRLRHLYTRLQQLLETRNLTIRLMLLGVDHTGHLLPDLVPALAEADLVTLELPTTPVKAYLATGRREELHVRNIFWQDLLEYFVAHPAPCGVYGVNVNPHVRYLRARFYYRGGGLTNDFEAPATVVALDAPEEYPLEELGGTGTAQVSALAVLERMPPDVRSQLERNGIVHVGPGQNPFGPGRHLVLLAPPPTELVELQEHLADRIEPLAGTGGLDRSALLRFVFGQLLEGLLLPVNDFYLLEQLCRHVVHAAEGAAPGSQLRVAHVAGCAHLPVLARYLEPAQCPRFALECTSDPRFPLHESVMVSGFFARHLEDGLHALSLQKEQFHLDRPAAERLMERYLAEEPEDVERRVLLRALWTRDLPPPQEFHTLAEEIPLCPSAEYLDGYASRLDRLILEHVLGEQPIAVLREMNDRLAATHRRGLASVIAQELQEQGWDYRALREDPVIGPHARRMDQVREGFLEGREPVALFREALRSRVPACLT